MRLAGGKAYLVRGQAVTLAGSGASAALPDAAEEVVNNNRMRQALEGALAAFRLSSPEREVRAKAIADLRDVIDEGLVPLLDRANALETDERLKAELAMLKAKALIGSADASRRLAAAELLAQSQDPAVRSLLMEQLAQEGDAGVKSALQASLDKVQARLAWGERLSWGRGYVVHVQPLPEALSTDLPTAAAQINRSMEHLVMLAPQQYLWGYARYKMPRENA